MNIAIDKLKDAEVVLMNKIKRMKDGKPKYAASAELDELRYAIQTLTGIEKGTIILSHKGTAY
jgi:hypothetical protein